MSESKTARAGRCAIVGRPNVGKSTLINTILGQKLVIATPIPGTTRTCVLGVYASNDPPTQIAFVDTPGMHRPKSALGQILVQQARLGLLEADVVVFVVEVPTPEKSSRHQRRGASTTESETSRNSTTTPMPADKAPLVSEADRKVLEMLEGIEIPVILAINKVDRLQDKTKLLPLLGAFSEAYSFAAHVPISATKNTQVDALLETIRAELPEGQLYEDDFLTDRPERFFVAELVREAAMGNTRQEIPHGVAVVLDRFEDEEHITKITATVVVEKESHKRIVIGRKGQNIKAIGTEARIEMEAFLGRKVFLELWVKVIEGWTRNPTKARLIALEGET